ncbi:MAG: DUF1476 domain-containing protein [Rhodospirillales bacterium]|nr:DUF1476 domain-containing protein [Rhodospirillales bacterium]
MSDIFKKREKGEETKYKLDQERQFKVEARRNKLIGLWAAERMGLSGVDADTYAKAVVAADFEHAGSDDVIRKLVGDFAAKNVKIEDAEVRRELDRFEKVAADQVAQEPPKSLG